MLALTPGPAPLSLLDASPGVHPHLLAPKPADGHTGGNGGTLVVVRGNDRPIAISDTGQLECPECVATDWSSYCADQDAGKAPYVGDYTAPFLVTPGYHDYADVWVLYPCHQSLTDCCETVQADADICEHCNYCPDCCGGHRTPHPIPWQVRGDIIPSPIEQDAYQTISREAKRRMVDPVQCMADFYLCDYVLAVATPFHANFDGAHTILLDALRLQQSIVARCDGLFQTYLFAAIGGEVRHHHSVYETDALKVQEYKGRNGAWRQWLAMGETNCRTQLTADCIELFGDVDNWDDGYGGSSWRIIAETLHARLTGQFDAKTFVDRVFSLQHNNGSCLDKVEWPRYRGANLKSCQTVGDSHHATRTGFSTLLNYASDDVRHIVALAFNSPGFLFSAPYAREDIDKGLTNVGIESWYYGDPNQADHFAHEGSEA